MELNNSLLRAQSKERSELAKPGKVLNHSTPCEPPASTEGKQQLPRGLWSEHRRRRAGVRSLLSMQRVDFFLDFYPRDAVATCTTHHQFKVTFAWGRLAGAV